MSAVFLAQLDAARTTGGRAVILLWVHESTDVIRTALGLRWSSARVTALSFLDNLVTDVRIALRGLSRQRVFAVASIGSLALGMGGVTTLWSVLHGVMLAPLPYRDSDRLVQIRINTPNARGWRNPTVDDYLALERGSRMLDDLAAGVAGSSALAGGELQRPTHIGLGRVSWNFFSFLGVEPVLGRTFSEDDVAGDSSAPPVVISHELWHSAFGGDRSIIGRSVMVVLESSSRNVMFGTGEGFPHTIIGVTPPGFRLLLDVPMWQQQVDAWIPSAYRPGDRGGLTVLGHSRPDVGREDVEAEASQLIESSSPAERKAMEDGGLSTPVRVDWVLDALSARVKDRIVIPFGAMLLVMLLACANVANLLLGRLPARSPELSLRAAVGAARGRLLAQLVVESLVLAGLAASIGLVLAVVGTWAISSVGPVGDIPRLADVRVDMIGAAFCAALAVACALVFGVLPAWRGSDTAMVRPLGRLRSGAASDHGSRHGAVRGALLSTQIAIALVLLTSATLLARSFSRLLDVDLGFEPRGVAVAEVTLPFEYFPATDADVPAARERLNRAVDELLERLRADPAVASAGIANSRGYNFSNLGERPPLHVDVADTVGASAMRAISFVSPGYLETLGVQLLRGRTIRREDGADVSQVVVINEMIAKRYFPGEDPLGKLLWSWDRTTSLRVVGVVRDAHEQTYTETYEVLYLPLAQSSPDTNLGIFVRAAGSNPVEPALITALDAVVPGAVVRRIESWDEQIDRSIRSPRFYAFLFSIFAGIATAIAAGGVFAVLAFLIGQRTHEIGVRVALGGSRSGVIVLVMREVALTGGVGLVVGGWGAVAASRALQGWLYEVQPGDAMSLGAAMALLATIAVAAAWVPARRAASIDPATTLRAE